MTLLVADTINKRFGGVHAARDVSLSVAPGQMVALIGPNGAGKSTTFNIIGGQIRPDSGTVKLDGRDITGFSPRQIWRQGVGRTFQVAQVFVSMSVVENVQMALISHRGQSRNIATSARDLNRDEALSLLADVGLADAADGPISTLSYGDVKRIELAIALAGSPRLLLMDEPTAGMAPKERSELMQLVARLVEARKLGVLFTEHDMDAVFEHADHILVLVRGRIIAEGTAAQIRSDERVKQVYLGETGALAAIKAERRAAR